MRVSEGSASLFFVFAQLWSSRFNALTLFFGDSLPFPQVKHLDYDDLHVTQGIREEGLRGGGNRGGRGLDISDARYAHDLRSLCTVAQRCGQERVAACRVHAARTRKEKEQ